MTINHIIPSGEHYHHTGIVQVIDDEAMDAIVNNFSEDIYITLDHLPHYGDTDTRSYGWVKSLIKKSNGIWASIDWTNIGESAINDKLFKYFSPEFLFSDMTSLGETKYRPNKMSGLSLTNAPAMKDGMQPIFNSKDTEEKVCLLNEITYMKPTNENTEDILLSTTVETVSDSIDNVADNKSILNADLEEEEVLEEEIAEDVVEEEDKEEEVLDDIEVLKQYAGLDMEKNDFLEYIKGLIDRERDAAKVAEEEAVNSILNSYNIPVKAQDKWKAMLLNNKQEAIDLMDITFSLLEKVSKPTPLIHKYSKIDNTTVSSYDKKEVFNSKVKEYQKENKSDYTTAFNAIFKDHAHLLV